MLKSMIGIIFDSFKITVTLETFFQHGSKGILSLAANDDDACFLRNTESACIDCVNKGGRKEKEFSVNVYDFCMSANGEVYFTNRMNKNIGLLSPPTGTLSTSLNTRPLEPLGICLTMDGHLLVTLVNTDSEIFQRNSNCRSLVRQMKMTGEVIHEYEYQEDGKTRLFKEPVRVTQNNNTDVCTINWTSGSTGELVILSFSGSLLVIYRGHEQKKEL